MISKNLMRVFILFGSFLLVSLLSAQSAHANLARFDSAVNSLAGHVAGDTPLTHTALYHLPNVIADATDEGTGQTDLIISIGSFKMSVSRV